MAVVEDVHNRIAREALAGRLPIMPSERIYSTYTSYLWTCTAFSAATWAFLIGSFLPFVGNTKVGIMGYLIGVMIGMVPVTLASGLPSIRYGIETIEVAKSSFGTRGIVVPLFGLLATFIGWSYVLMAMTATGLGNLAQGVFRLDQPLGKGWIVAFGIGSLVLVWAVTSRGPWLFERLSKYIGPGLIGITVVMLGLLLWKYGFSGVTSSEVPADQALTPDRLTAFMFSMEWGVANALTWWPVMGGLTRLLKTQDHVMGPSVLGVGVLGAAFISSAAAFAAVTAGSADPTIWMVQIGGDVFGSLTLAFVLLANTASMVIMMYLAGVSIQHMRIFTKIRWELVIALLLLPGVYFAFRTDWLLSNVMTWLTYNGLMFAGITGITLVDYFILRRQELDARHLFNRARSGKYHFWAGVNVIAVVIVAASIWFDIWLYHPVTLATHGPFRFLGSSLPTIVLSGVVYYLAMRLIAIPLRKGAYPDELGEVVREREALREREAFTPTL